MDVMRMLSVASDPGLCVCVCVCVSVYLRDVDSETAVDSRTLDTHQHTQIDAGGERTCTYMYINSKPLRLLNATCILSQ